MPADLDFSAGGVYGCIIPKPRQRRQLSHSPIKGLAFGDVMEVREVLLQNFDDVFFRRARGVEDTVEVGEERLDFGDAALLRIFHDAEVHELRLVLLVRCRIEFLERLLTVGIGAEEFDGVTGGRMISGRRTISVK